MYLVWRSSTPEPTTGDGIIWTYIKDATHFIPLFTEPGTLQLELDNLLDASLSLDGVYNGKLESFLTRYDPYSR